MSRITKEDIKRLLDYGMISGDEQTLILNTFEHESIEVAKKKFISVLESNIQSATNDEKKFEQAKDDFLAENIDLESKIFALRIKKNKIKADIELTNYRAKKAAHQTRVRNMATEYKRSLRRLDELVEKARRAVQAGEIDKARKGLKGS